MNEQVHRLVRARFAREKRFEVPLASAHPNRVARDGELDQLKNRLLRQLLTETPHAALAPALRRAANEAAALSWLTACPLLVLPALLEEKAAAAKRYLRQQALIRHRSRMLLSQAA